MNSIDLAIQNLEADVVQFKANIQRAYLMSVVWLLVVILTVLIGGSL
jgi:hypothetical protein